MVLGKKENGNEKDPRHFHEPNSTKFTSVHNVAQSVSLNNKPNPTLNSNKVDNNLLNTNRPPKSSITILLVMITLLTWT